MFTAKSEDHWISPRNLYAEAIHPAVAKISRDDEAFTITQLSHLTAG